MDWSKSKTIFIVVFLILNIFLYTQYVDVYTQSQHVEVLAEKTIEAKLKDDNITYHSLPNTVENVSYLSGKMRNFNENELTENDSVSTQIIDHYMVRCTIKNPVAIRDITDKNSFTNFMQYYVQDGTKYKLWEINEEQHYALFFQVINDRVLYYNSSGYVKVFWNDMNEIYGYEQTMLEKIEKLEQEESTIPPIQALQALYTRSLLQANSKVVDMNLGYSTLVQLTQTQVFAPTWQVRVEDEDGKVEEHFVNAFEGKVLEVKKSNSNQTIEEE